MRVVEGPDGQSQIVMDPDDMLESAAFPDCPCGRFASMTHGPLDALETGRLITFRHPDNDRGDEATIHIWRAGRMHEARTGAEWKA